MCALARPQCLLHLILVHIFFFIYYCNFFVASNVLLIFAIDVVTIDASTGVKTLDKKTRYKRAAKGEATPPPLKKTKVSQDVVHKYDKYVTHACKFNRKM
jgi:hypothetical protein